MLRFVYRYFLFNALISTSYIHALVSSSSGSNVIPITVISGFLGSGKTTLVQHLLNNSQGSKIAVIVNDVAGVNIDNKLIVGNNAAGQSKNEKPSGIVELSNGCACCSLADELLPAVSELVTLSDLKIQGSGEEDSGFDHIVVELSGVASPKSIRANFQDAEYYGMPLMERVRLDTMVTVVDCSTFLHHLQDKDGKLVNEEESPHLFFRSEEERLQKAEEGDSWMKLELGSSTPETATISQLLVEQTEISDIILLNKVDTIFQDTGDKVGDVESVVVALNTRAKMFRTKFGVVDKIGDILGAAKGLGIVDAGIADDHRDTIDALSALEEMTHNEIEEVFFSTDARSHSHEHSHAHDDIDSCTDPDCTDSQHSHSHSHSHSHEIEDENSCSDPDCTDPSHDHSHSHGHAEIGTFVFRARKPFHPIRLLSALKFLPVIRGLPDVEHADFSLSDNQKKVFKNVLRSKGFCWLGSSHVAAMYWSHAGSSFELQCLGRWWATLPQEQWPEEAKEEILSDFDRRNHDELAKDFSSVGDRRQEVVLIGPGIGLSKNRKLIQDTLEDCLLTENEFQEYQDSANNENALKEFFSNPIPIQMLTN